MKVTGVFQQNLIQAYKDTKKKIEKSPEIARADVLQISAEARNMQNISTEGVGNNPASKFESIKNQIKQGTYNPDPALIAQRMMAIVKGSEV